MKKSIISGAVALLAVGVSQATVISAFEFSSSETFMNLPNVSNSDLAAGLTDERDPTLSNGNFLAGRATDGLFGTGFGNNVPNGDTIVRYKIDLGEAVEIGEVNSYAYGDSGGRSQQYFTLYGSTTDTTSWDESDAITWTAIASVDTRGLSGGDSYGVTSIYNDDDAAIGTYRELMWVTAYSNQNGTDYESTIYKEFDVVAIPEPATLGLISAFGLGMVFVRRRLML
jgi:hypothetical protein